MSGPKAKRPLLIGVFKRAVLYFLGLDLLALFYYILGNRQEFLVETQILLLRIVSILSCAALLAAATGLALSLRLWTRKAQAFSIWALAGWSVSIAGAAALAFLASGVRVFAGGY